MRRPICAPIILALAILAPGAIGASPNSDQTKPARGLLHVLQPLPNRYIVVLADVDIAGERRERAARAVAEAHAVVPDHVYHSALLGFSFEGTEQQAQRLALDPAVAYVEEDSVVSAESIQYSPSWGLDRIDQPDLPRDYRYHFSGAFKSVGVFIIDSGINPNHADFFKDGFSRAVVAGDFIGGDGLDCNGHGTHVASTIGGAYAGVVKWVTLQSLRVLDCNGSGPTSSVISAIDHVARVGAGQPTVANMSLGGPPSQAMDDAVRRAVAAGIVMVVAAGNDNTDASTHSPARVAEAVTVGATTSSDIRASFSNYGPVVDLFAPGQLIIGAAYSDNTSFVYKSGTSMAAPHVAGAVALFLEGHRAATPAQVRDWFVGHAAAGRLAGIPVGTSNLLLQVRDINSAAASAVSVPAVMHPGRTYQVTVAFANTGLTTWSSLSNLPRRYLIGSQNPPDNLTWGGNRVELPTGYPCCKSGFFDVPTDREVAVNFSVVAPQTPGSYNFQWRMIQELGEWFGASTPNVVVQVAALSDDGAFYAQSVPPKMRPGGTYKVSVSYTNTGSVPWTAGEYVLEPVFDTWGINRVYKSQSGDVPPGGQIVFNFDVRAWPATDAQPFQWRLMKVSSNTQIGDASPRQDIAIGDWIDDAELIAARVPQRMRPGQIYNLTLTYRNRGSSTWTDAQPYWLGIRQNGRFYTFNHALPVPDVQPGEVVTFSFPVTAASTAGVDHLQWQMVNAGDAGYGYSEWFGDLSPDFAVHVANWADDAAFVSYDVPPSMPAGSSRQALVTFKNTGTQTWTQDWPYWLATTENAEAFWSFNTSLPVPAVAPNQTVTVPVTLRAPATPGTYFVSWQMVDAGPNEDGPTRYFGEFSPPFAITVTASGRDLTTWAVSDPPSLTSPGSTFKVSDWVRNGGSIDAGASTSRYYLSEDGTKNAGDTLLTGTRAIAALPSGASSQGSVDVTIPVSMPVGTYYLLACADDLNVVTESDETNNCRAAANTVTVMLPDLVETLVTNPPLAATPGSAFLITDKVDNQSTMPAGASTTRYYLSVDSVKNAEDVRLSGTRPIDGLAAGASSMDSRSVSIPSSTPLGTYRVLACADDTKKVPEAVESNNCVASQGAVVIAWPDLITTAVSNPPATALVGTKFTVSDVVANQGAAPAASSSTRYYLSIDTSRDAGDVQLTGNRVVVALEPGATSSGSKKVTIGTATPPGTYYVLACADAAQKLRESDEINNCRASATTIVIQ